MRQGNTHCAQISPDIVHLHHHHCSGILKTIKERSLRRKKVKERKLQWRGCRIGRRGRRTKSCETKKQWQEKKKNSEWKLRQDSCLPGYPHLFIDLKMIERDWEVAWQQSSAWWLYAAKLFVYDTEAQGQDTQACLIQLNVKTLRLLKSICQPALEKSKFP